MLPQSVLPLRTAALSIRLSPIAYATPSFHQRHAFSSATSTPDTASAATSTEHVKLDWDSFLRLRKVRRRYNLVSSIFGSMLGTSAGVGYLANKEIDPSQMIMGMDPLIMFGVATLSCGAIGWLAGPVLGSSAFGLMNGKHLAQIAEVSLSWGRGALFLFFSRRANVRGRENVSSCSTSRGIVSTRRSSRSATPCPTTTARKLAPSSSIDSG